MEEPNIGDIVIGYSFLSGEIEGLPIIGRYDGKLRSGHYELELGYFENNDGGYQYAVVDKIEKINFELTDMMREFYGEE